MLWKSTIVPINSIPRFCIPHTHYSYTFPIKSNALNEQHCLTFSMVILFSMLDDSYDWTIFFPLPATIKNGHSCILVHRVINTVNNNVRQTYASIMLEKFVFFITHNFLFNTFKFGNWINTIHFSDADQTFLRSR